MKFFHLADLHIGIKLYNRDLYEDQKYVLGQIVRAAGDRKPDAVVIAGDVYDKAVPSAESVELFDSFISDLTGAVPDAVIMIISGNHDSAARLNLFRGILKNQNVHMIGEPPRKAGEHIEKVTVYDDYGAVNFRLLPFVKPSVVKEITGTRENGDNLSYNDAVHRLIGREDIDESERNVLVSHQFYLPAGTDAEDVERMDSEIRTVGNIDEVKADFFKMFDYVALGHIHKPMRAGSEFFRYAGTPMPYSVSEAGQKKGIIEVDMKEKGNVAASVIPLVPLRGVKEVRGTLDEVLKRGCGDYVRVVLTDRTDLDVFDMQDKIRAAFPYFLEITRDNAGEAADYGNIDIPGKMPDPFELCLSFLKDADDEDMRILADVINAVKEEDAQ